MLGCWLAIGAGLGPPLGWRPAVADAWLVVWLEAGTGLVAWLEADAGLVAWLKADAGPEPDAQHLVWLLAGTITGMEAGAQGLVWEAVSADAAVKI